MKLLFGTLYYDDDDTIAAHDRSPLSKEIEAWVSIREYTVHVQCYTYVVDMATVTVLL